MSKQYLTLDLASNFEKTFEEVYKIFCLLFDSNFTIECTTLASLRHQTEKQNSKAKNLRLHLTTTTRNIRREEHLTFFDGSLEKEGGK